jgi:hypothetical protein
MEDLDGDAFGADGGGGDTGDDGLEEDELDFEPPLATP